MSHVLTYALHRELKSEQNWQQKSGFLSTYQTNGERQCDQF